MSRTQRSVPYWAEDSLRESKARLLEYQKLVKRYKGIYSYGRSPFESLKYCSSLVRGDDGSVEHTIHGADMYMGKRDGFSEVWGKTRKRKIKKQSNKNRRLYGKRLIQEELDE